MFTSTFGAVILASLLACLVTTIGIYIISKYEEWGNQNIVYFISFAAGVLSPLRSGDQFLVSLNLARVSRLRLGFQQDIYRLPDCKLIAKTRFISTSVNTVGRPFLPKELEALMDKLSK